MEPYTRNGGIIGKYKKYGTSVIPIVGTTQIRSRPTIVGSQIYNRAGFPAEVNVNFSLTGGTNTTPQAGDLVVLAISLGAAATTLMTAPAGYTQIAMFASNGTTYDSVLYVGYKVMGATPDTTFPIPSALSTANSQMAVVFVWRNFDVSSPLDVTSTVATGVSGRLANPPSITPATSLSVIMAIGACAYRGTVVSFTNATLSGFRTTSGNDTYDGALGAGYFNWTSGTYDPSAFSITGSTTSDSWTALTLAIRGKLVDTPIYGNKENTGVWDLATTSIAPTISTNNVFSQPRNIWQWAAPASAIGCTIVQDTIETPFNNTPLKMTITSDSDPYISTVSAPAWNIAAATAGQTWELSVWAMTDLATSGEIYLFEANSSSVWTSQSNYTMPLKKYWKQFKVRRTFTDATTAFVQIRLDGQNTGGFGYNIWFDGLQVRRIV